MKSQISLDPPWGKCDRETGVRHHLAHHCADVAACFMRLADMPVIRARLETAAGRKLSAADMARLEVVVFLHDAGKLHPGFQAKIWPDGLWRGGLRGHVREGLDIFLAQAGGECLPAAWALHLKALGQWGVTRGLLRAVLSHHGRPAQPSENAFGAILREWVPVATYDPLAAAKAIGALLPLWFPEAFSRDRQELPDTPAFEHLVSGLTALADWIGSDADRFKYKADLDPDYIIHAKRIAAETLLAFGVDATRQREIRRSSANFREVSGFENPSAQQALIGDTSLDEQLVILEAETGSGKTEAALWRYAQLFEAGKVDGLYFAVPTRAAAVQLHARVTDAAIRLFGDADPQPVLAVPGYVRAGSADGQKLPHWRVLWDDSGDQDRLAARWAAEHAKRFLAAQIAVGTVDQVMLGALKVKHAHLRSASLSRSLLVIDEAHASDRFMTTVQKRLLDGHLGLGGYAMLMSATLGSSARTIWLGHGKNPDFATAVAAPYPAVWTKSSSTPRSSVASSQLGKAVKMETLATMAADATAARALAAARAGARVLVIRNTVNRAIETLTALEALTAPNEKHLLFSVNGVVTLHHSRFAPDDRKRLDAAVEAALKPDAKRELRGCVIIGSQTLEQSLDICADFLITDLCPVDVLLQRIGRLHRHRLPRPAGYEHPQCIVMVPEGGLAALLAPAFENGLGAWKGPGGTLDGIYRDVSILELTRRLIAAHPVWQIPQMNRILVESATHRSRIEVLHKELGDAWKHYDNEVIGSEFAKAGAATLMLLDKQQSFEDLAFPSDEERIRTRLGEDGARIVFAAPLPTGPFGKPLVELVLPAHMSRGLNIELSATMTSQQFGAVIFEVDGSSFVCDRFGVRRFEGQNESPDRSTFSD